MKVEKGNWHVMRDCHSGGGVCFRCRGTLVKTPIRIEQGRGYSESYAKFVAQNWSNYNAKAEPMEAQS